MRNQRGFPVWYRRSEKDQEKIEHHKTLRDQIIIYHLRGGGGELVDHMEDQMIHGERKGNQSSPMEYKVQYKLGTIEMCVYFLPFPLPDFFPSFRLPSLP